MSFKANWMECQLRGRGIDARIEGGNIVFARSKDKGRGIVRKLKQHLDNWEDNDPEWALGVRLMCYCGRVHKNSELFCPVCGQLTRVDPWNKYRHLGEFQRADDA